jgi:nitroimidazol reductase NimA-like FMN-containing flavoprotein (pyridoxamine 5'-phosphate oxidase superfamily)
MTKTERELIDSGKHLVVRWRNQKAVSKAMSEAEARELIEAGRVGRLGCVDDREPYVVPFNYFFEGGFIYGHSLLGKKVKALRAHPRSCVQVDQILDEFHWRSVIAFGNFEEIHDELERKRAMRKLFDHFPLLTPVESLVILDVVPPEVVVFRIIVDRITGVEEG